MSGRQDQSVRTIHPKSLALVGDAICLEMLTLARDLRSGAVPPESYNQKRLYGDCGTACCILGHLRQRVSPKAYVKLKHSWFEKDGGLVELFAGYHPSDPQRAADAIERFVFDGSDNPWQVSQPCKGIIPF